MIARLTARLSVERLAWMAAVASIIVIGFLAIGAHDHRYFYIDDTESGAVGNWIQLGHILRDGQFPSLVLDQWMAGNYPVEGQGGLWNPVQMLINYLAPSFDDLALLAAVVKCIFSIILGWGLFRVAIEYGARAEWAAVAGACAPFAGFTLFFEQTSWITSLIGMAWVMQAWASGVRYARGRSGPLPVFTFLYLAISVGYVHATIMAGVVVGALVIGERMYQGSWIRPLRLAAAGVAAASCGAITFLPGVLTSDVTWRTGDGGVVNDNFLTAPWSETITASIPTAVTSIQSWSGETTFAPVTYIGWFVIPALAFVAWRRVVPALRELTAPLVVLGTVLVITAGPSEIGQIRWPARLLPFAAVVMLILAVVLLSRFGTIRPLRPRLVARYVDRFCSSVTREFLGAAILWTSRPFGSVHFGFRRYGGVFVGEDGLTGGGRPVHDNDRADRLLSSLDLFERAHQVVSARVAVRREESLSTIPGNHSATG